MRNVVLASNNAGKVAEFQQLLAAVGFTVLPQSQFNLPSVEETGLSFVENAILKARYAAAATGLAALADDSGIEVDALNGAPGIYSARFAGINATDADNNAHLLAQLAGVPEHLRTARYQCVLVYMRHSSDPMPLICSASWEGRILTAPQGEGGFGYDPLFWLPELNCTSAQLPQAQKNAISHRGKAMAALLAALS
ncbi:MAG TPA: RdgB/HAM1 family non-canonical purine NTP pyrophosphatase [Cellvibrionaceae bacterium]|nr:RdgB/HAM1 family non-canonical purine NTP pyrophosphatase [Cellvibrionaceae bacterium]HNG59386.1 RdgB/HAM1 family non-canonical purine NTP pyrophosphatase [Cellvibrionaceae bacterium]